MGEDSNPPPFLTVGRILAPWGRKGEVKVRVATDFPERFAPSEVVYLDGRPLEIESSRPHQQHLVVKLAGIDTIEDAAKLRDRDLSIPGSEIQNLPEGEYYAFQLVGLTVNTSDGRNVGKITDIIMTPGNDVYVVEGDGGEVLIPATDEIVKSVDLDRREVVIDPIEGLL